MKTRIILFLLCLITLNAMGQTNGTITRQRKTQTTQKKETQQRKTTQAAPKKTQPARQAQQQRPTASTSRPRVSLDDIMRNMVYVEGGTFTMGATSEQQSPDSDEKPTHRVSLSSYYIGKYEVTQALWKAVMGNNPSNWKGDNLPVEQVSWDDCQAFLRKLNAMTGKNFRLPTEAEWEFAARGGNRSRGYQYSGSNILGDVAWYDDNSGNKTHPVGTKAPNELGIYDMSGNVWEWCLDWKGSYSSSAQTNPTGPNSGSNRVYRGGSWFNYARICRVAIRDDGTPGIRDVSLGLRLALSQF
ncbi:MAG: formylglycine-generating enzyme family protein [Prevotella sp.]